MSHTQHGFTSHGSSKWLNDYVWPLHIAFTWYSIGAIKKIGFLDVENTAYPKNTVAYAAPYAYGHGTKSGGFYKLQIFKNL